jgi:WD40 repeat protein
MRPGTSLRSSLVSTENQPLPALVRTDTSVDDVAVSSVGRTAATLSNGYVTLWNVTDLARPRQAGQPLPPAEGQPGSSVAISPDGEILAAARPGGGFSLWNVSSLSQPRLAGQVPATGSSVNSLAFSPDGRTLAVGTTNFGPSDIEGKREGIALWDITDPARPRQIGDLLNANGTGYDTAAFSPDGRTLAVADNSGTVTLWNVTDLARPQPAGGLLSDGDSWPMATLAFSANGRLLAGTTFGGDIALWDTANLSDPQLIVLPLSGGSIGSVAVAPDGRTVAVAAGDSNPIGGGGGTVALWDVSNPAGPRRLGGNLADEGTSEAFSPDGKTLAVASVNGTVTLWDVTDPARPRQNGQALSTGLATQFVAYSPRGSVLATESTNETIQLWNTSIAYAVNQICATTSISPQQWRQYLPQVPYQAPCQGETHGHFPITLSGT